MRKTIFTILLLMISFLSFSKVSSKPWLERRYEYLIKPNSDITFEEYKKELNLWKKRIPNNLYRHVIIDNAIIEEVPIVYIYSIAYTETGNFRYMRSLQPNMNGTIDHGIMAINSANLKNQQFMTNYFYDEWFIRFNINNQFHIGRIGVKYFKKLLYKTGNNLDGAIKSYNCGYRAWSRDRVPNMTYNYASKIHKMINLVSTELLEKYTNSLSMYTFYTIPKEVKDNYKLSVNLSLQKLYTRRYLIAIGTVICLVA